MLEAGVYVGSDRGSEVAGPILRVVGRWLAKPWWSSVLMLTAAASRYSNILIRTAVLVCSAGCRMLADRPAYRAACRQLAIFRELDIVHTLGGGAMGPCEMQNRCILTLEGAILTNSPHCLFGQRALQVVGRNICKALLP